MPGEALLNKVAVVTGGSSGIGACIAARFATEGARVAVSSRDFPRCEQVASAIAAAGGTCVGIACDVRREQEVLALFDRVEAALGPTSIVVASAGISGGSKTVEEYTVEEWSDVLATNLTGVFLTVREGFRRMKPHGGHIIIMGSQAGVRGYASKGVYCATKFGVRGLAQALGEEGRRYNINVSVICSGTVDTPILAATGTKVRCPLTCESVADTAVYLAGLRGNAMVREVVVERMNLE